MNRPLVLIDMDGVLCDLERAMTEDLGKNYGQGPDRVTQDEWFKGFEKYIKVGGIATLPLCQDAEILFWIYNAYKDKADFAICTSRSRVDTHLYVLRQKATWLGATAPESFARLPIIFTCTGEQKALFARPGALLIDDTEKNIKAFEEAGGSTVLYKPGVTTYSDLILAVEKVLNT